MKGDLIRGQYVLRGSSISGKDTAVRSESCDHHLALLWHQQLCHRSETEMQDRDRGLLGTSSHNGSRHVMTLRDVYFSTVWGIFLKGGQEAFSTIASWRTRVKRQRRASVDRLRAGNG